MSLSQPARLFWLVALATVGAAFVFGRRAPGGDGDSHYDPLGYVQRADKYIDRGWLGYDCTSRRITLSPEALARPDLVEWYESSYLKSDVERFNRWPETCGWYFVIEGCTLRKLNPFVHRIELPLSRRVSWKGALLSSESEDTATLLSTRGRTISLVRALTPVRTDREAATRVGAREDRVAQEAVLFHFGGRVEPAARIYYVGDSVAVNNRAVNPPTGGSVRLLGHPLPAGRVARLETGDWLHLESVADPSTRETLLFLDQQSGEVLTANRRRNDVEVRETDDDHLGWEPGLPGESPRSFADSVARSVSDSLSLLSGSEAESRSQFDVQLTLRRKLHTDVSATFRRSCQRLSSRPFSAGVTVMDGKTGEILALATHPWKEDLPAESSEPNNLRRLLRNQNFVRHPIGSAGKPFLYAAIGSAHPVLLDTRIAGHPEMRRPHPQEWLFQCRLPRGYDVPERHGNSVGLESAIEISCNRYAVEFAVLALAAETGRHGRSRGATGPLPLESGAPWPPPGSPAGPWIGQTPLKGAPDIGYFAQSVSLRSGPTAGTCVWQSVDRLEEVRFREGLEDVTGAATFFYGDPSDLPAATTVERVRRSYSNELYDFRPWDSLLSHLAHSVPHERGGDLRVTFQGISPERVNLSLNQIASLRDYVSLVLGGASSSWTNVQLAEGLSRLVTGRAVIARLVRDVLRAGEQREAPHAAPMPQAITIRRETRERVLAGMARVVEGDRGTARSLRVALDRIRSRNPGRFIQVFSKTGTPTFLQPVPPGAAVALRRLVASGRLQWDGTQLILRAAGGDLAFDPDDPSTLSQFEQRLGATVRAEGVRPTDPVLRALLRAFRHLTDYSDELSWQTAGELPEEGRQIGGPLYILGGTLKFNPADELFENDLLRAPGAVYIFALVSRPAVGLLDPLEAPGDEVFEDPNSRIVITAIHLAEGPTSQVAVSAAADILPSLEPLLR